MECIIHFYVIRDGEKKALRGLIMLDRGQQPGIPEYIRCFERMGFRIALENERELTFRSLVPTDPYVLDIFKVELDDDEEDGEPVDTRFRRLVEHFVKND